MTRYGIIYQKRISCRKRRGRISKQNRPILFSLFEHIRKLTELSKKCADSFYVRIKGFRQHFMDQK